MNSRCCCCANWWHRSPAELLHRQICAIMLASRWIVNATTFPSSRRCSALWIFCHFPNFENLLHRRDASSLHWRRKNFAIFLVAIFGRTKSCTPGNVEKLQLIEIYIAIWSKYTVSSCCRGQSRFEHLFRRGFRVTDPSERWRYDVTMPDFRDTYFIISALDTGRGWCGVRTWIANADYIIENQN